MINNNDFNNKKNISSKFQFFFAVEKLVNSQVNFVVEKQFNVQLQLFSTFINVNEINISNFFFRIKRVYEKNKKF